MNFLIATILTIISVSVFANTSKEQCSTLNSNISTQLIEELVSINTEIHAIKAKDRDDNNLDDLYQKMSDTLAKLEENQTLQFNCIGFD